jgi:hypothetical protein
MKLHELTTMDNTFKDHTNDSWQNCSGHLDVFLVEPKRGRQRDCYVSHTSIEKGVIQVGAAHEGVICHGDHHFISKMEDCRDSGKPGDLNRKPLLRAELS